MSYRFNNGQYYRMPTHFGPSLGPRQGINDRRYTCIDKPKSTIVQAAFEVDPKQVEAMLPPAFELREPNKIIFSFSYDREIEWLAGRGYNTCGISVPATYKGKQDYVDGELLLVLWENMADPIITGREDLGFSKVFCDLPEPQFVGDDVICRASWDGCEFASLRLVGLKEASPDDLSEPFLSEGLLHYKYIPKTGCPGEADAAYAVLTPGNNPNLSIKKVYLGQSADCDLRQSTWEELPTLVHIVNALSNLSLGDCVETIVLKTHGGKDLSDQRILT